MATLTIDGTDYVAIGDIGWSTETLRKTPTPRGGYVVNHTTCYIQALIDVRRVRITDANKSNATVRLSLDDGRVFEGHEMFNTASGVTDGNSLFVKYEGRVVTQVE